MRLLTGKQQGNDGIRMINIHQKTIYEDMERRIAKVLVGEYVHVLEKSKNKNIIKILDIGCGGGFFAKEISAYFEGAKCEVIAIDAIKYDTWGILSDTVSLLETSVDKLDKTFEENTFDIIFANRTFHHFVRNSWKNTIKGMENVLKQIRKIIKNSGYLCITDHFFDGLINDKISSKIIYALSSCNFPPVVAICQKVGVESAGIGVCFLSKKMWINLMEGAGFKIEVIKETGNARVKEWYKKILFLNKMNELDNKMIITP